MQAINTQPAAAPSSNIWTAEGRVGRAQYFWLTLITGTIGTIVVKFVELMHGEGAIFALLLLLPFIWVGVVVAIKRCHDINQSGWLCLLSLIPLVNFGFGLYLLFKRGMEQPNRYGPPTSPAASGQSITAAPAPTPAGATTAVRPVTQTAAVTASATSLGAISPSFISSAASAAPALEQAADAEEALWAQALAECDGGTRRPGLWAREFSKAHGVESVAKAGYMAARVKEMREELLRREQERLAGEDVLELERIARMDTLERCAHLRAREQKRQCPNCKAILPVGIKSCPLCDASFREGSAWSPEPMTRAVSVDHAVQTLGRNGYVAGQIEGGGWSILKHPGGEVAAYALSAEDLAGIAQFAGAKRPLALWVADLLTPEERLRLLLPESPASLMSRLIGPS